MALSFVNFGPWGKSVGQAAPFWSTLPTGLQNGDLGILFVSAKPYNTTVSMADTGMTPGAVIATGTDINGDGGSYGSVQSSSWWRTVQATDSGANFGGVQTSPLADGFVARTAVLRSTAGFDVASVGLVDNNEAGTSVVATATDLIDVNVGDILVMIATINYHNDYHLNGRVLAIPGCTLTSTWPGFYDGNVGVNSGIGAEVSYHVVTAGQATGLATYTATANYNYESATAISLVRLTEATSTSKIFIVGNAPYVTTSTPSATVNVTMVKPDWAGPMRPVPVDVLIKDEFNFEVADAVGATGSQVDIEVDFRVEVSATVIPGPKTTPMEPVYWQRVSETYPDPVSYRHDRPDPATFKPTSTVTGVVGRPVVLVGGADYTFWNGVPVNVRDWSSSEPFGWEACQVDWEHATALTSTGSAPMQRGKQFDIALYDTTNHFVRWLWRGFIAQVSRNESKIQVTAVGMLIQAKYAAYQPSFYPRLLDIGTSIPEALNQVVSRRYGATGAVTTGIKTAKRGGRSSTVLGTVQDLLAISTTDDGMNQWTVMPTDGAVPVVRLKDRTTEHWTVTLGARGVKVSLQSDLLGDPNVIYGSGQDPDHSRWSNSRWPGSNSNIAPPYPNNSASNTIKQGEYDRNTDSGHGVSDIQARLAYLGYGGTVTGYFDATTKTHVRQFQANAQIQVDGVVAGQTWGALWEVAGILGTPFFFPIAFDSNVMPYTYGADGTITGNNPAYDPTALRVERYYNFGEGVTKATATTWAQGILNRNNAIPDLQGTLYLDADPRQGSRRLIRAGENIRVRGIGGVAAGALFHVARSQITAEGQAQLRIDTRARDLMELDAILEQRREVDPAQDILKKARQSNTEPDLQPWHSEPPAGIVPPRAVFQNLWSVVAIPVGEYGQIVRTTLTASPPSPFAAAVFSRKVTSNWLKSVMGNPLDDAGRGWGSMTESSDVLENAGYLMGWGGPGAGMGYDPAESSPTGDSGDLTGKFEENSMFDFVAEDGSYIWLALFSPNSTRISGRFYLVLPYGSGE